MLWKKVVRVYRNKGLITIFIGLVLTVSLFYINGNWYLLENCHQISIKRDYVRSLFSSFGYINNFKGDPIGQFLLKRIYLVSLNLIFRIFCAVRGGEKKSSVWRLMEKVLFLGGIITVIRQPNQIININRII